MIGRERFWHDGRSIDRRHRDPDHSRGRCSFGALLADIDEGLVNHIANGQLAKNKRINNDFRRRILMEFASVPKRELNVK